MTVQMHCKLLVLQQFRVVYGVPKECPAQFTNDLTNQTKTTQRDNNTDQKEFSTTHQGSQLHRGDALALDNHLPPGPEPGDKKQ